MQAIILMFHGPKPFIAMKLLTKFVFLCCRDPNLRPSFGEIMAALKPLQKPITSSQVPRPAGTSSSRRQEKGRSTLNLLDDRRS